MIARMIRETDFLFSRDGHVEGKSTLINIKSPFSSIETDIVFRDQFSVSPRDAFI